MSGPLAIDLEVFVPAKNFEKSPALYSTLGRREHWRRHGLVEIEIARVRLQVPGSPTSRTLPAR